LIREKAVPRGAVLPQGLALAKPVAHAEFAYEQIFERFIGPVARLS
jgi:hypothetical protein